MAISFEDAKALLEKGQISSKTFDSLTGVKWDKKAGGGLIAAAPALIQGTGKVAGAINDSGQFTQGVNVSQAKPVDEQTMKIRQENIGDVKKSKEAVESIGKKTEEILTPTVEQIGKGLEQYRKDQIDQAETMRKNMDDGINAIQLAEKGLNEARAKATIDPDRYVKNMTGSDKVMSAIGLALSGMGSGITGQPNFAYDNLQKRIQNDIDGQAKDIQNEFNRLAGIKATGESQIGAAQTRAMSNSIAAITTLNGYAAALDNAMQKITSKTQMEKAQLLKLQLQQALMQKELEFNDRFRTTINSGDSQTTKTFLELGQRKLNGEPLARTPGARENISKATGNNVQPAPVKPADTTPVPMDKERQVPTIKKPESSGFFNELGKFLKN